MSRTYRVLAGLLMIGLLALAACSGGSSTGGNGAGTPSTTAPTATATPKPKPTGAPAITTASCQQLMTVAEANTIMQPATPATTIEVIPSDNFGPIDNFGSCYYTYGSGGILNTDLIIGLGTYNGPVPISQQDITNAIAQISGRPDVTVTTFTNVTGVGDQAAFLAMTFSEEGATGKADILYVLYGKVLSLCESFYLNAAAPPDADQMSKLQQCAAQVVSRL